MKQNKSICIFLSILLCILSAQETVGKKLLSQSHQKNKLRNISIHFSDAHRNPTIQKIISAIKIASLPAAAATLITCYQETIVQHVQQHSIMSIIMSYLLLNYFCDSLTKYKHIKKTLTIFEHIKKISRCLICAIAVKNTMMLLKENDTIVFDEQKFLDLITSKIPYSFEEIEQFIIETFSAWNHVMEELHLAFNADVEEKIYLLFTENITEQHMQTIMQRDPALRACLNQFYTNPTKMFSQTVETLSQLLKDRVKRIEKICH